MSKGYTPPVTGYFHLSAYIQASDQQSMSTSNQQGQRFSSRWGFLLSALGVAIGTGNIWRFPRIVAQNGSDDGAGAFLIIWVLFLFIWSIPLIIGEYALGMYNRKGVVGTILQSAGERFAWMGSFMVFVGAAITFFYSVVLGWCVYYFVHSILHANPISTEAAMQTWEHYQTGAWPLATHGLVMILGSLAIWKGISRIEKINRWLMPTLLIILIIALIKSLTLNGAGHGMSYLFTVDWGQMGDPALWVAALTQNAWDTGAGWGLFITYGAYMQMKFGIVKNAIITAVGNNIISMICALMIFGTCFAIMQTNMGNTHEEILDVMQNSGPASTGLTFIWMPQLFEKILFGKYLTILFFLGLALAGFSSMIAQLEMTTRTFVDGGMRRPVAIIVIVGISYLVGIPSAVNLNVLANQDFVWGLSLMIAGGFCAFAMIRFGTQRIRKEIISRNREDIQPGMLWDIVIKFFVPTASIVLLTWLLITSGGHTYWYDPFEISSIMTCLVQWGIVLSILIFLNRWVVKRTKD